MITFSLRMVVPAAKRQELMASVGALLAPTRVQPDCVSARLLVDTEDRNAVTLVEEWASRSALERYLNSDTGRVIVAALEYSSEPPDVRFDTIEHSAGIEVLAQMRGRNGSAVSSGD